MALGLLHTKQRDGAVLVQSGAAVTAIGIAAVYHSAVVCSVPQFSGVQCTAVQWCAL
jgi:hypothetical protein